MWIISSSCSSEYIDMKALTGLLLLVFGHGVSSVLHSLHYSYTGSSGLPTVPEFVAVGMVDGVQFYYYDSNTQRTVLKQDWMEQVIRDHPDYLERSIGLSLGSQQSFKTNIGILMKRFNQTGGAHVYQEMYGCEWDDEDGITDGYDHHGYDGEDFLSLDLKTLTWVAPVRQAITTKRTWDQYRGYNEQQKNYYTKECVDWLKKYLVYGRRTLQRTERPRVSLLQRSPSSPVVCHATGFYPDRVVVFWRRDGQELHEQVDPGEVLPNHDGTFQVSVDLNLKAVPQEDWGRYECVVQLKGIKDISTPLDPALIRTNWGKSGLTIPIIIGSLVLLLAAAAAVVGVLLYKKRNASDQRHKPVGSDTSSENTEGQNPAPEAQPLTTVKVKS
ncbi:major histocompatibility complex class I-related gene protein isoform X2 [Gadus morhua]|uniref:major histocompatibility complex class I-related gene protein isoform X2 n=1 Tax=Gadus morhua TaxID=8049 RepID=UPI0011B5352E|nr:major histocompatibility complex class I-related gene protein-like isoform X2 [Gadus morhua]